MGNGVKILLVALLILSVVVVAKFVQEDSSVESGGPESPPVAGNAPGNRASSAANPSTRTIPPESSRARRPGTGRIVSNSGSNASSAGRVQPSTPVSSPRPPARQTPANTTSPANSTRTSGTGRILNLPMKEKKEPEDPAKTAPTSEPASDRVSVKVTPPDSLSPGRSDEIGSPGFDPVPTPSKGRTEPLVTLDPKTSTTKSEPFKATRTDLRDFSGVKRLDNADREEPRVVDAPITTPSVRPGTPSPFNQPVSPGGQSLTRSEPATSGAFPKTHTVVQGDSYWDIAELYYGSGVHYKSIQKANAGKLLRPGMKVKVPAPPKVAKPASTPIATPAVTATTSPTTSPTTSSTTARRDSTSSSDAATETANKSTVKSRDGRYYIHTVRAGETLSDLAKRYYGSPRSFDAILDANKSLHYESLRVDQKIRIPVR